MRDTAARSPAVGPPGVPSDRREVGVGLLLASTTRRTATFVPTTMLLFTGLMVAIGVMGLVKAPGWGSAVGALVTGLLFLLPLSAVRRLRREGDVLVARGVFSRQELHAPSLALGVRVTHGARGGASYIVYAQSGGARIDLVDGFTLAGAEDMRRRLVEALGLHHPTQTDAWARAADVVQRERRAYDEASRAAQAQVDAYYASGAFRRAGLFILLGVVVYLLVVGLVVFVWKP